MGLLKDAFGVSRQPSSVMNSTDLIGGPDFAVHNPYEFFRSCKTDDKFATMFPNVSAIATAFMKVTPTAIDANGEDVESGAVALEALRRPNNRDSMVMFLEKLATVSLVQRKTYIAVHASLGGKPSLDVALTPDNIAGFTFIEAPTIQKDGDKIEYRVGDKVYKADHVMVIEGYGVDPNNLYAGYAPWGGLVQMVKTR